MADIQLDVVVPNAMILSVEVDELTAIGAYGQFGVLPGHRPMLTTLGTGVLTYTLEGSVHSIAICGGYAEIGLNKVMIMAESAELSAQIDLERAKDAQRRAEETLKSHTAYDKEYTEAELALERSMVRQEAAKS